MNKFITLIFIFFLIIGCSRKSDVSKIHVDSGFSTYVNAFTSGVVSSQSGIKVILIEPFSEAKVGEPIGKDFELFSFEPAIEGTVYWVDDQTLEYKPKENLPSGQPYKVRFALHKLIDVPAKYEILDFGFVVLKQRLNVYFDGMRPANQDFSEQELFGMVKTSDLVDPSQLQKSLEASQNGKPLEMIWEHLEDRKTHNYIVKGVVRGEAKGLVNIKWDGKPIGSTIKDQMLIEIPPLDEFSLIQVKVNQTSGLYYSIQFSDPVNPDQDLTGLISLSSNKELRFVVLGQEVKVYPNGKPNKVEEIRIDKSIMNSKGVKLITSYKKELSFHLEKPAVELLGDGVIIPSSGNVGFPFRAINLKAVNVRVLRIFEHNINQFFQVNQFNGSSGLTRVGRLVYDEAIDLVTDTSLDYGIWNNFNIGLNDIIEPEPGAIYRVMLSFEPHQSLYPCSDTTTTLKVLRKREWNFDENEYFQPDSWYEDRYDYRDIDNPCTPSYYMYHDRSVSSNIFSSNLGIISKETANDTYNVTITDLRTSEPLTGVEIEAYNFQNIKIGGNKTNSEGVTQFKAEGKPYLLVATKGKQKGYLRVDKGSALSVSLYDVGGSKIDNGVKGLIYGERGVWRPGDSIYLSLMLEDKLNVLPETHPIIMELYDPMGKSYQKIVTTHGERGLYSFVFKTESSAPTGKWQAVATFGNSEFRKALKIETIKPNRIKIAYDFGSLIHSGQSLSTDLNAKWMYGSPASNLKVTSEMTLSAINTTFDGYGGFYFDDRSVEFHHQDPIQIEAKTNENGIAKLNFNWTPTKSAPGMLKISFNTKVYEKGGDFSQDFLSKKYSPFKSYVGVKLEAGGNWLTALDTEKKHKVAIAVVDENGSPLNRKVTIEVYKLNWNWWWEGAGGNEITNYINRRSQDLIKKTSFQITSGKSFYDLSFPQAGWGKYLLRVVDEKSGHSSAQTFFGSYSSWYNDSAGGDNSAASALNMETDKDEYNVGEKIKVTVPSGGVGNIYVTVEKGNKILDQMWVKANKNSTDIILDASVSMTPNVYVSATLIQPHVQVENSLPIRMYGVVPIRVYDKKTRLEPEIVASSVLQPEKSFKVSVKERNGRPMAYTLAVVDEGLLSLTRFKTPVPWDKFYAKEALSVRTWDMYNYVMSAQTGKMAALLAVGGDEALNYKDDAEANRFKPVVTYLGPFFLDKNDQNSHEIHMPNYIGAVRVMVVGGYDGAYGSTEKELQVKQPLMVLSTMPRVLGPSEKIKIPVNIITMDERIKEVKVKITTNDLLQAVGSDQQSVVISKKGEKTIFFDYQVARKLGVAEFKVEVSSGKNNAFEELEILVRPPNPKISTTEDKMLETEAKWSKNYKATGVKGSNAASLQISRIPNLDLEKHLDYLIQYPHSCIEQTTSSVFPQLFLPGLMNLSESDQEEIKSNIIAGIQRMRSFQVSGGGFSYWPGGDVPSEWGSNYAGHFMIEAKNLGYELPDNLINGWLKFQQLSASNWQRNHYSGYGRYGGDLTQAYRLYTLALSGHSDLGAMNRLRNDNHLSNMGAWRLAAAYALVGRKDVAEELTQRSRELKPYRSMSYSFGSDVRDMAMMLETMHYTEDNTNGFLLLGDLTDRLNKGWHSTQTRAYSLLAIGKFIGASDHNIPFKAEVVINGKSEMIQSESTIWSADIDKNALSSGKIEVTNRSEQSLFVSFTQTGIPIELNHVSEEKELNMTINYQDINGRPLDIKSLEQGQDFKVIVVVKHPGIRDDYKEVALNQVFPSGWQIINTRVGEAADNGSKDNFTYRDIRDDRVYTYFDLERGKTKSFEVLLNATFVGQYYMPAVFCAPMYDESVHSQKPGQWIEVVKKAD